MSPPSKKSAATPLEPMANTPQRKSTAGEGSSAAGKAKTHSTTTNPTSGTSDESAAAEDDEDDHPNSDEHKHAVEAPLHPLEIPSTNPGPGPSDELDASSESADDSDFDIADDDDDYTGLDLVSISSGDLHVHKRESTFIEQALRGESDWANELESIDAALQPDIDWNDDKTYQQSPGSGLYDDFSALDALGVSSPLNHVAQNVAQNARPDSAAQLLTYNDADPALRRPLFGHAEADSLDFLDGSTSSSSSSSSSASVRSVSQVDDAYNQSPESLTVASNDSDTEDEDMTAEIESRARRAERRKKMERKRKQKTPQTIRLRPKAPEPEQPVDSMKQFLLNPRKPAALTIVTPRGSVLKVMEPRDTKFKIRWVTARTRPAPVVNTPMSAAYAVAMQSSMFRILHCPNSPSLSFQRNKRAMASQFGANLMLTSPGLMPIGGLNPDFGGLQVEYGEATDQDITDLFLDLDNGTVAGDDSDCASTPGTAMKRVSEVEDDEDSRSDASNFQTPTPLPRLDHTAKTDTSHDSSLPSSALDEDMSDASQTPSRPRKRTLDSVDVDGDLPSPTKRRRPHSSRGIAV